MFSMKKAGFTIFVAALAMMLVVGAGCGEAEDDAEEARGELTIASTNFSEPWILAEAAKILLEKEGFQVEHVRNIEGSTLLHEGFISGDFDLYVSWTGTQFAGVLDMEMSEEWRDREKVEQYVKEQFDEQFDATWFPSLGFENTYALAVQGDFAQEHGLQTTTDLVDLGLDSEMVCAVDTTFLERPGDGYADWTAEYGLEFAEAVPMDYGIMYRSVGQGDVDAAVAYSTDGRIIAENLQILEDNLDFFPPYDGAFAARNDVLDEHPEIEDILSVMWGAIDEETMGALNEQVDVQEREYDDVARDFLEEMGWID